MVNCVNGVDVQCRKVGFTVGCCVLAVHIMRDGEETQRSLPTVLLSLSGTFPTCGLSLQCCGIFPGRGHVREWEHSLIFWKNLHWQFACSRSSNIFRITLPAMFLMKSHCGKYCIVVWFTTVPWPIIRHCYAMCNGRKAVMFLNIAACEWCKPLAVPAMFSP